MTKPLSDIQSSSQRLDEAINDHPQLKVSSSTELLTELGKHINSPITLEKLRIYSNQLNLSTNAWEAESISSLIEVFSGFEHKNLEEIIELINQNKRY